LRLASLTLYAVMVGEGRPSTSLPAIDPKSAGIIDHGLI
jgi:hypothetical protein